MERRNWLTDEEVEREIAKLNASPSVKLAQKEVRLKYKRRLHLYNLRSLEKRGQELSELGITLDNIEEMMAISAESE